jgi:PilZ domain
MGRRQYKRCRIALPVTLTGLDANGNRFRQTATTVDIGVNGLRLSGVRCLRAVGEPVQVEYKGRRAHYRVAWIGAMGTCWDGLVGLEGVEGARVLFAEHLPAMFPLPDVDRDHYVVPPSPLQAAFNIDHAALERREMQRREVERRRHPRFNCAGTVQMRETGSEVAIAGRINELSLGGCYVEMMSPLRTGTAMRLDLAVGGRNVQLEGIVRTSQPTFGMGVEFSRMAPSEADKLHAVLAELNGEAVEPAPQPAALETPPAKTVSAEEIGEAVLRWFGAHDALTREEFLKLTRKLALADQELTRA